jgi:hypothetical protein
MTFISKYRLWIAAAVVIILGLLIVFGFDALKPLPETTALKTRYYTFNYPRTYDTQEYAPGVVSVGHKNGQVLIPDVEVNRYQSDPQAALPKDFDTFMKLQASALCGTDASTESVTCTEVGVTPYTSPKGFDGQKLDLTLVRKNLKSGTTTSNTYGPFYVFNTTSTSTVTTDNPLRYSAIFVYPALSAFLDGTTSPALMDEIMNTLTITK